MKAPRLSVVVLLLLAVCSPVAVAELSRADRKQAKELLAGTLYMRIDAPCGTGRHPYGTYKIPLVEVSPESVNTEAGGGTDFSASAFHAQSTYWGVGPNDAVVLDDMEFDEDAVEIELEGVGRSDGNDTVIKFVRINTLADFQKAFERAFAKVPLQDEHPDWPAETRKAIADRRLEEGMTKRQVFYVTGSPESVTTSEEGGKKIEVWMMRQHKGMKMGYWTVKGGEVTGTPASLRFEDGKLVDLTKSGTAQGGPNLDD